MNMPIDYYKNTGTSGSMRIRDIPEENIVEFWINSNNTTTWNAALPWGWTINGSTGSSTFNYQPGAGWRRLGNYYVSTSQTVTFRLGNSGTTGFGGPTTFNQYINRQTVPPAPTSPVLTEITASSMRATFQGQGDGNSVIYYWELGYGTDPSVPTIFVATTGSLVVTGLSSGVTYYFWARGVNAIGAGPWSERSSAITDRAPSVNAPPTILDIGQTTATLKLNAGDDGGDPISLYQFGWVTTSSAIPTTNVISVIPSGGFPPATMTNLPPGTMLYFRSRTRNSVGWSSWSNQTVTKTIAGARIKVGSVWKDAVPYVRHAGVWKLASSWVKVNGVWRQAR